MAARLVRPGVLLAALIGLAVFFFSAVPSARADGLPSTPDIHLITGLHQGLWIYWWAPASDGGSPITGYEVQYRASGTTAWTDAGHSGLAQPAVISGLRFNTAYEARVRAINANGKGPWSTVESRRTAPDDGRPDPPWPPTLTPGDGKIAVSWTAPAYTGKSAILGYRVRYTTDDGATWRYWSVGGSRLITGTSTTITGLDNGVLTGVVVAARNSAGTGRYSPHTPEAEATPAAALTLSLKSSHELCAADTSTELSWTISGGIPPYTLTIDGERVDADSESHRVNCGSLRIDPQTDQPLPNQSKTFGAVVNDSSGRTARAEAMVTVAAAAAPPAPAFLRGESLSKALRLSWTTVAAAPPVSGYELEYQSIGWNEFDWPEKSWTAIEASLGPDAVMYLHDELDPDRRYRYRLRASNSVGAGGWSGLIVAAGRQPRPGKPTLTAQTAASGSVKLSWSGGPASAKLWQYRWLNEDDEWGHWTRIPGSAADTAEHVVSGLIEDARYRFILRVYNAAGVSPLSELVSAVAGLTPTKPGDRATLWYNEIDSAGGAIRAGSYALLKNANDLASGITNFRDAPAAAALLVNTTGFAGRSYADFLDNVSVGNRFTWRISATCWSAYEVTMLLSDPSAPARKLFAIKPVAQDPCTFRIGDLRRGRLSSLDWGPPPSEPIIGADGIRILPHRYPVEGGHTYRIRDYDGVGWVVFDAPADMRLIYTGSAEEFGGHITVSLKDEASGAILAVDYDTGEEVGRYIPKDYGSNGETREVGALFDEIIASARVQRQR